MIFYEVKPLDVETNDQVYCTRNKTIYTVYRRSWDRNKLVTFHGNRGNIYFSNGTHLAEVFYTHHKNVIKDIITNKIIRILPV
jgi:hypothetical protein